MPAGSQSLLFTYIQHGMSPPRPCGSSLHLTHLRVSGSFLSLTNTAFPPALSGHTGLVQGPLHLLFVPFWVVTWSSVSCSNFQCEP